MWEAIKNITTGLALVAFVWAGVVTILRHRIQQKERLVLSASQKDRPELVKLALESFHIDTTKLTRDAQYRLLTDRMRADSEKFRTTAIVVCLLACLFAAVAAYAISRSGQPSSDDSSKTKPLEDRCNVPLAERPLDCKL